MWDNSDIMSDGPFKSLPLSRHWKRVAKYIENDAYSFEERRDALFYAFEKTIPSAFLNDLSKLSMDLLIPDEYAIANLEKDYNKLSECHDIIDMVKLHVKRHLNVTTHDIIGIITTSLEALVCRQEFGIVDHYAKFGSSINMRKRIEEFRKKVDVSTFAKKIIHRNSSIKNRKNKGIDEGPVI